ncbi:plasmid pRiA4b ORF-3 family protein [Glutamicibacter sp. AOP12-B1-11]|uniref:plasmid pRiA4b ORF-3 family protein n=1 Tax=Glutamicibacter sp. AOP12-B1-11 TaxID=3457725 RepID=UPI004034D07E
MAKKKKKQVKQGHPGRVQAPVVSMGRVKVDRGLDALSPEFVRWYGERRQDSETALLALAAVRETLGMYAEVVGLESVTEFNAPKLFGVLNSMIEFEEAEEPEDLSGELRMVLYMAWADYLDFIEDTGRWTQDLAELSWLRGNLETADPFSADALSAPGNPGELEEQALAELRQFPIVELAYGLARWCIGKGAADWGAGPGEQFLAAAAKALEGELPKGLDEAQAELVLSLAIASLAVAGVITLEAHASPKAGPAAGAFQKSEGQQAFSANYVFLQAFLDLFLEAPEDADEETLEAWGLSNLWLLEAIEGSAHRVAEPRDEQWSPAAWEQAHQRLGELRILGLVEEGEHYTLPRLVAATLTDLDDDELDEEDLQDEELDALFGFDSEEPKRDKRAEPFTGKVLQLKLGLKDAKPPIWRRVLVPTDLHLGDLHDIIQASFDWYDGHLHEFRSGGYGGTSYGPDIEQMEFDEDESGVLISELLKAEKDRLDYAYDFGDGWEIRIEVEKVLESEAGALPRCTGGRRMAPLEDSGGTWGWAEKVAAIGDPAHPEHGQVMEWLEGMGLDEIDPTSFSMQEINEALDQEF